MSHHHAVALPYELRRLLMDPGATEVAEGQQWLLTLMRAQGTAVLCMLWRMLGCEQDVMDAYQSAVCRLAVKGRKEIGTNPAGYFYTIAKHVGIEILRKRQLRHQHWPTIVDAEQRRSHDQRHADIQGQSSDHRETLDRMRAAILELPARLRDVVILHDLAELPYRDVARIMAVTTGSARVYRREAIVRLGKLLGQRDD